MTFLSPADAARQLRVSAKALRLYEERGLLTPGRTPAGWRTYGPAEMVRAEEIVALRALGFSLAQVARVLSGDASGLEPALAAHQSALEGRLRHLTGAIDRIRDLRRDLATGATPAISDLTGLKAAPAIAFNLPWPWDGERFELRGIRPLTWLTGPLFSGKTKLAMRLAEVLPGASFIGLERQAPETLGDHASKALAWLIEDGASDTLALRALLAALDTAGDGALVIDLIEQGLAEATQLALAAHLRARGPGARPVFAMTRSTAMLDLAACGPGEEIILCPANHSPPLIVSPHPGAPGYEAVATCLAPPDVRARTEGVIAFRPPAA
ncbi:MAG: MerR family transcriptional regulator [Hyphomonadaceae bacterium]